MQLPVDPKEELHAITSSRTASPSLASSPRPASTDTEQQVERLATIARANHLQHVVVVSDGTHLFRIQYLCRQQDLDVYTSPRPPYGNISDYNRILRYFHEMAGYTALRLHLNAGDVQRSISGGPDE